MRRCCRVAGAGRDSAWSDGTGHRVAGARETTGLYAGRMISVEARGRLGNHMFQFAFGLAAAARLGTDFAMNDELLRPAFGLGEWNTLPRRTLRAVRFRVAKQLAPHRVVKIDNDDDPAAVLAELSDHVHYAGFFQSRRYFEGVDQLVRTAFQPRPHHVAAFRDRYEDLARAPYVCCHARRTDYEAMGGLLPLSYYSECLAQADIPAATPVVFVGDDLDDVSRAFGNTPAVRFEHNDEIVDLQLLIHAAVVVTSNSSFGWWGSWLGAPDRIVYAPRYWFGFRGSTETPRAIVPPGNGRD
jgi:hypothetical protein